MKNKVFRLLVPWVGFWLLLTWGALYFDTNHYTFLGEVSALARFVCIVGVAAVLFLVGYAYGERYGHDPKWYWYMNGVFGIKVYKWGCFVLLAFAFGTIFIATEVAKLLIS